MEVRAENDLSAFDGWSIGYIEVAARNVSQLKQTSL